MPETAGSGVDSDGLMVAAGFGVNGGGLMVVAELGVRRGEGLERWRGGGDGTSICSNCLSFLFSSYFPNLILVPKRY